MSAQVKHRGIKQRWPKGCMPPSGYCAWHEWARAQGAHGLKQSQCSVCKRYCFPQESCNCAGVRA